MAVAALAGCGTATTTTAGATTTAAAHHHNHRSPRPQPRPPAAGAPFKFGVAGPMTGQYANYGASHKQGAEIAVDELNAAGGVNGGQASFATGDDLGDPKQAVLVAQQFIDDKDIVFVDGHQFSGATIAAGAKYEVAGIPMISPSATKPDISPLGKYIWRSA